MPFKGSRYEGLPRTRVVGADEVSKTFLHLRTMLTSDDVNEDPDIITHTVIDGDMIDDLALRYGGSETLWWIIVEVNEMIDPFNLVAGQELLIPSKDFFRSFAS